MSITSVWVSDAAHRLHPGLADALKRAGVNMQATAAPDALAIIAAGEPSHGARFIRVGRTVIPGRSVSPEPGCDGALSFAGDDLDFAAALIAASARGGAPAAVAPVSRALLELAGRVAARDVGVLINGATGTGKEVLANHIHRCSPRRDASFVAVNCAALPEAMLEAMLFGHERGAFTGASASAKGLFRAADKGTLLLDEVTELPLPLQASRLRQQLSSLTSTPVVSNAAAGVPSRLADLGIVTARDGTLTVDEKLLAAAVATNPDAVNALLTKLTATDGPLTQIHTGFDATVSATGTTDNLVRQRTQVATNTAALATRMDDYRANLVKQYAAMEAAVAASKATQSFLDEQIKAWQTPAV